MSQQWPSLQRFLRLVLLFDRQQRLEELRWLRREDFKGAGVEERGALWNQTCMGTFSGYYGATQTLFHSHEDVRTQCNWCTFAVSLTWIVLAFNGRGAKRTLLEAAAAAVHMVTVVLDNETQFILVSVEKFK